MGEKPDDPLLDFSIGKTVNAETLVNFLRQKNGWNIPLRLFEYNDEPEEVNFPIKVRNIKHSAKKINSEEIKDVQATFPKPDLLNCSTKVLSRKVLMKEFDKTLQNSPLFNPGITSTPLLGLNTKNIPAENHPNKNCYIPLQKSVVIEQCESVKENKKTSTKKNNQSNILVSKNIEIIANNSVKILQNDLSKTSSGESKLILKRNIFPDTNEPPQLYLSINGDTNTSNASKETHKTFTVEKENNSNRASNMNSISNILEASQKLITQKAKNDKEIEDIPNEMLLPRFTKNKNFSQKSCVSQTCNKINTTYPKIKILPIRETYCKSNSQIIHQPKYITKEQSVQTTLSKWHNNDSIVTNDENESIKSSDSNDSIECIVISSDESEPENAEIITGINLNCSKKSSLNYTKPVDLRLSIKKKVSKCRKVTLLSTTNPTNFREKAINLNEDCCLFKDFYPRYDPFLDFIAAKVHSLNQTIQQAKPFKEEKNSRERRGQRIITEEKVINLNDTKEDNYDNDRNTITNRGSINFDNILPLISVKNILTKEKEQTIAKDGYINSEQDKSKENILSNILVTRVNNMDKINENKLREDVYNTKSTSQLQCNKLKDISINKNQNKSSLNVLINQKCPLTPLNKSSKRLKTLQIINKEDSNFQDICNKNSFTKSIDNQSMTNTINSVTSEDTVIINHQKKVDKNELFKDLLQPSACKPDIKITSTGLNATKSDGEIKWEKGNKSSLHICTPNDFLIVTPSTIVLNDIKNKNIIPIPTFPSTLEQTLKTDEIKKKTKNLKKKYSKKIVYDHTEAVEVANGLRRSSRTHRAPLPYWTNRRLEYSRPINYVESPPLPKWRKFLSSKHRSVVKPKSYRNTRSSKLTKNQISTTGESLDISPINENLKEKKELGNVTNSGRGGHTTDVNTNSTVKKEPLLWLKSIEKMSKLKSQNRLMQCLQIPGKMVLDSMDNIMVKESDDVVYGFYGNDGNLGQIGYIHLKSYAKKPPTSNSKYVLKLLHLTGNIQFELDQKMVSLEEGSLITIKKGVSYSISNMSNEPASLFFCKLKH